MRVVRKIATLVHYQQCTLCLPIIFTCRAINQLWRQRKSLMLI